MDAATKGVFAPLVAGGGKASAATLSTTVKCLVANAGKPQAIPATGGI